MLEHNAQTWDGNLSYMDKKLIEDHLDYLRRTTPSRDTRKHRTDVIHRLARQIQPVELIDATAGDLDKWQAQLAVSDSSIRTYTNHVRSFYDWLRETGHRNDNPAEKLPMPKRKKNLPRPIPEKDLQLALRCANQQMTLWLVLAGWIGLRAGEIARLRGDSIIDDPHGMLLRIEGKGNREDILPVPDEIAALLREVQVRGRLFHTVSGKVATPKYVSETASEFFRSLGLPYVLHQLRHRFGTQHYAMFKDIRLLQELMRHSSPETTAMYVGVAESAKARSIRRFAKTLPAAKPRRRLG